MRPGPSSSRLPTPCVFSGGRQGKVDGRVESDGAVSGLLNMNAAAAWQLGVFVHGLQQPCMIHDAAWMDAAQAGGSAAAAGTGHDRLGDSGARGPRLAQTRRGISGYTHGCSRCCT